MCERLHYLVKCTRMAEDVWVSFLLHSPLCLWSVCVGKKGLLIEGKTGSHREEEKGEGIVLECFWWFLHATYEYFDISYSFIVITFPKQSPTLKEGGLRLPQMFPSGIKGGTLIRWNCSSFFIITSFHFCYSSGMRIESFYTLINKIRLPYIRADSFPFRIVFCLSALTGVCSLYSVFVVGSTPVGSILSALSPWQPAVSCFGKGPYNK